MLAHSCNHTLTVERKRKKQPGYIGRTLEHKKENVPYDLKLLKKLRTESQERGHVFKRKINLHIEKQGNLMISVNL